MNVPFRVNLSAARKSEKSGNQYGVHLLGPIGDELTKMLDSFKLNGVPAPITTVELLSSHDDLIPVRTIVELHSIPAGEIEPVLVKIEGGALVPKKDKQGRIEHRWHIFALPDDTVKVLPKKLSELATAAAPSKTDLTGFVIAA